MRKFLHPPHIPARLALNLAPLLVFVFFILGSIYLWWLNARYNDRLIAVKTSVTAEQAARRLTGWTEDRMAIAKYFASDWESQYENKPGKFERNALVLMNGLRGIQAVNWIDNDWTIQITVPRRGNEGAEKKDLHDHPNPSVRDAIQKASRSQTITRTAASIELLQGGRGFATYSPLFSKSGEALGFINIVFRIDSMVKETLSVGALTDTYFVALIDDGKVIFSNNQDDPPESWHATSRSEFPVVDRNLILVLASQGAAASGTFYLILGVVLATLSAWLIHGLAERGRALRRREARYRAVVETQTELIIRFRPDFTVSFVNEAYCRFLNVSAMDLLGKSILDHLSQESTKFVAERMANIKPDNPSTTSLEEEPYHDGTRRWIRWNSHGIFSAEGELVQLQCVGHDITEQKEAEDELRESENRHRTYIENSPYAILIVDGAGKFIDINAAACRMTGYSRAEMLNMTRVELADPEPTNQLISAQAFEALLESGQATYEILVRRKDGSKFPMSVHAVQLEENRYMGFGLDVSEQRNAELAAQKNEYRLHAVMDNSPCLMSYTDLEGNIRWANKRFEVLQGPSLNEFIGKNIVDVFPADIAQKLLLNDPRAAQRGAAIESEEKVFHQDGSLHTYYTTMFPLYGIDQKLEGTCAVSIDITDRLVAEAQNLEQNARSSAILESIVDGIITIDEDGLIESLNPAAEDMFGYAREELLGSNIKFLIPEPESSRHDDYVRKFLSNGGRNDVGSIKEIEGVRKNGSRFPLKFSLSDVEFGESQLFTVIIHDLTEEKSVATERRRLGLAIDQTDDSMIIMDPNGIILYCNPAFERLTGRPASVAIGRQAKTDGLGKDDFERMLTAMSEGKAWKSAYSGMSRKGEAYYTLINMNPVRNEDGTLNSFVVIQRDITKERELEKRLQHADRLTAIGTLAGSIAHDFNNILHTIIGYSELASARVPKEDTVQAECLLEIEKAGRRAEDLVKRILSFSRESDAVYGPVSLQPLIQEALQFVRGPLPANVDIQTTIDSKDSWVLGDPTEIHQVIMNLCINASHAMETSGGVLRVTLEEVQLNEEDTGLGDELSPGQYASLTIEDTGCGMDAKILDKIFDPYFTTKDKERGTGLGLATVHGIISRMKGSIRVRSVLGEGSTFVVRLPLAGDLEEKTDTLPPPEVATHAVRGKVLIVDDEQAILTMSEIVLRKNGFAVESHLSADSAYAKFVENPEYFDIVVTDLDMPGTNGLRFGSALHQLRTELPIILTTGNPDTIDEKALRDAGFCDVIKKPFGPQDLSDSIARKLAGEQHTT